MNKHGQSSDSKRPPVLLFWETTRACNLSCRHCRAVPVKTVEPDELTPEESRDLIRQAAELGVRIFVFSGGEPLIRPELFELISYAKSLSMEVALATNGTLLTDDIVGQIKDCGVSRVSVSIDSHQAKEHDAFRGESGAFAAAIHAMEIMKKQGQPFQINSTVTRRNMNNLDDIVCMAERLGAAALHLFFLVPVGCGLEIPESERITALEYEELLHWFAERMKTTSMEMRATCAPHLQRVILQTQRENEAGVSPQQTGGHSSSHHGGRSGHSKGCLAGTGIVFVSSKGDVRPCGYMNHTVGNIRETGLSKLWFEDPVMNALREPSSLTGTCGKCSFRFRCGGCRSRALAVSGDLFGDEPMCSWGQKID